VAASARRACSRWSTRWCATGNTQTGLRALNSTYRAARAAALHRRRPRESEVLRRARGAACSGGRWGEVFDRVPAGLRLLRGTKLGRPRARLRAWHSVTRRSTCVRRSVTRLPGSDTGCYYLADGVCSTPRRIRGGRRADYPATPVPRRRPVVAGGGGGTRNCAGLGGADARARLSP
jgi:hypothetical protein